MAESKSELLDKIRKVLAYTKSPNENEAENAMLLAQRIMAENNLVMKDIERMDTETKEVNNLSAMNSTRTVWWHRKLASIISKNFRCYTYRSRSRQHGTITYKFVGLKEDVEIAVNVFNYAIEVITYNYKKYVAENKGDRTGNGVKNVYILGFLEGLKDKFNSQVSQNNWGLVIVIDPKVKAEYDKIGVKNRNKKIYLNLNGSHVDREAGYNEGIKFQMISGNLTQ